MGDAIELPHKLKVIDKKKKKYWVHIVSLMHKVYNIVIRVTETSEH